MLRYRNAYVRINVITRNNATSNCFLIMMISLNRNLRAQSRVCYPQYIDIIIFSILHK